MANSSSAAVLHSLAMFTSTVDAIHVEDCGPSTADATHDEDSVSTSTSDATRDEDPVCASTVDATHDEDSLGTPMIIETPNAPHAHDKSTSYEPNHSSANRQRVHDDVDDPSVTKQSLSHATATTASVVTEPANVSPFSSKRHRVDDDVEATDTLSAAPNTPLFHAAVATASAVNEPANVSPFSSKRHRVDDDDAHDWTTSSKPTDRLPSAAGTTPSADKRPVKQTTPSADKRPVKQTRDVAKKRVLSAADNKAFLVAAMVLDKVRATPANIQKKNGVSKGVARGVSAQVGNMLASEQEFDLINVRRIHYKGQALETIALLPWQLAHFPDSIIVDQFEANGRADISESSSKDKVAVGMDRIARAQSLWGQFNFKFKCNGRDAMNTMMCVLYDATAVQSFMKAVYDYGTEHDDGHERLAHVLVVRHGPVFVIFATAALHTRRLPLDWLLCQGFHTSAFLWLKIKQRSWDKRFNDDMGFATWAKQRRKTSTAPERMSDMTITGMHFLAFLHKVYRQRPSTPPNPKPSTAPNSKIEVVKAPTPAAVVQQYVYVKPHNVQLTADEDARRTGPCSSTAVDDGWCQEIQAFTDTFKKGYRKRCEADAAAAAAVEADAHEVQSVIDAHGHGVEAQGRDTSLDSWRACWNYPSRLVDGGGWGEVGTTLSWPKNPGHTAHSYFIPISIWW